MTCKIGKFVYKRTNFELGIWMCPLENRKDNLSAKTTSEYKLG
jgi:hypothetical protein